jgi:phage shock protein PspC (stress-responsive transcriptional regulator)
MTTRKPSLFAREDTMLGICQGVGEDLGFSPNILRVALALGLFLSPVATAAAYAVMGVAVLASRLIWPDRRSEAQAAATAVEPAAVNDPELIEYKQAA